MHANGNMGFISLGLVSLLEGSWSGLTDCNAKSNLENVYHSHRVNDKLNQLLKTSTFETHIYIGLSLVICWL